MNESNKKTSENDKEETIFTKDSKLIEFEILGEVDNDFMDQVKSNMRYISEPNFLPRTKRDIRQFIYHHTYSYQQLFLSIMRKMAFKGDRPEDECFIYFCKKYKEELKLIARISTENAIIHFPEYAFMKHAVLPYKNCVNIYETVDLSYQFSFNPSDKLLDVIKKYIINSLNWISPSTPMGDDYYNIENIRYKKDIMED